MNLLDTILKNPAIISQLSQQFGLNGGQTTSVIGQLIPVLARGLQNNTRKQPGADSLINTLNRGGHKQYFDDPSTMSQTTSGIDGNAILGHLLGSKDVSRGLASHTEKKTGISASIIKKMLPLVATIAMGALSKKNSASRNLAPQQSASSGSALGGLLSSFLDSDNDGSIADDLLSMAGKILLK